MANRCKAAVMERDAVFDSFDDDLLFPTGRHLVVVLLDVRMCK